MLDANAPGVFVAACRRWEVDCERVFFVPLYAGALPEPWGRGRAPRVQLSGSPPAARSAAKPAPDMRGAHRVPLGRVRVTPRAHARLIHMSCQDIDGSRGRCLRRRVSGGRSRCVGLSPGPHTYSQWPGVERGELLAFVKARGAETRTAVSGLTTMLLDCDHAPDGQLPGETVKARKALELKIPIVSIAQFRDRLRGGPAAEAAAAAPVPTPVRLTWEQGPLARGEFEERAQATIKTMDAIFNRGSPRRQFCADPSQFAWLLHGCDMSVVNPAARVSCRIRFAAEHRADALGNSKAAAVAVAVDDAERAVAWARFAFALDAVPEVPDAATVHYVAAILGVLLALRCRKALFTRVITSNSKMCNVISGDPERNGARLQRGDAMPGTKLGGLYDVCFSLLRLLPGARLENTTDVANAVARAECERLLDGGEKVFHEPPPADANEAPGAYLARLCNALGIDVDAVARESLEQQPEVADPREAAAKAAEEALLHDIAEQEALAAAARLDVCAACTPADRATRLAPEDGLHRTRCPGCNGVFYDRHGVRSLAGHWKSSASCKAAIGAGVTYDFLAVLRNSGSNVAKTALFILCPRCHVPVRGYGGLGRHGKACGMPGRDGTTGRRRGSGTEQGRGGRRAAQGAEPQAGGAVGVCKPAAGVVLQLRL